MLTKPLPAVMLLAIGPVASLAKLTDPVWVGQAYLALAPPPVAPVAQVADVTSRPQGWTPNQVVPAVITVGVVESVIQKPVAGLIK